MPCGRGWGHASENPSLPERLARSGILFLGPSAGPMKSLGDKIDATLIAQSAHVPTLPWNGSNVTVDVAALRDANGSVVIPDSVYDSVTIHSLEEARDACRRLQYPLMIKASEGGGGKGIRTLNDESELDSAWNAVRSEVPGISDLRDAIGGAMSPPGGATARRSLWTCGCIERS